MLQPKMAIIRCLNFSSYKEAAVFTIITVYINFLSAYPPSCECVCGYLFLCRWCMTHNKKPINKNKGRSFLIRAEF
jgi:hypothetical protein